MATTGPKISSWKIRASAATSANTVGRDVVAGVETLRSAAAGEQPALALADLDVAHHLVVVLGVHQRADLGLRVVRVADHDRSSPARRSARRTRRRSGARPGCGCPRCSARRSGRTPRTASSRSRRRGRRRRTRRPGTLAAQLHGQPLSVGAALPKISCPVRALAGERDQRHAGVLDQRVAGVLAQAVDQVEDARAGVRPPRRSPPTAPADSGVNSAGFSTTVQPEASAGRQLPALQHERACSTA